VLAASSKSVILLTFPPELGTQAQSSGAAVAGSLGAILTSGSRTLSLIDTHAVPSNLAGQPCGALLYSAQGLLDRDTAAFGANGRH
jgi:hypothetical protein